MYDFGPLHFDSKAAHCNPEVIAAVVDGMTRFDIRNATRGARVRAPDRRAERCSA
jgi:hypothetical protein